MSTARRPHRLLIPTLAAVFLELTFGAYAAQAAGSSTASGALQVAVQVVRSCAVDTNLARSTSRLDVAGREALLLAAQASLANSCGATQTRVVVADVQLSLLDPRATIPRLDVEF